MVHQHQVHAPADIDKWSRELKHPSEEGMKTWHKRHWLKDIYNLLHQYDGVMVLNVLLTTQEKVRFGQSHWRRQTKY